MFDHSSHYQYLIDAAWEAVEQAGKHSAADDAEDLPDESNLATQMVRTSVGMCSSVLEDGNGLRRQKGQG